jgi:hypothetical protein
MKPIIVAIHGILTSQTNPSWPDRFDAWMYRRDPEVKVLKKEYSAGPFPRWNCWVKDPLLSRGLANELELFVQGRTQGSAGEGVGREEFPPIWFVAHSNGAVIALLVTKRLIARGYWIGGLILTGAACEADVERNGVLEWLSRGTLGVAIAYSSEDDAVLGGPVFPRRSIATRLLLWVGRRLWGWLAWPYGSLGRTGWLRGGRPLAVASGSQSPQVFTRWFAGGHSGYFQPQNIERTFEQIWRDVQSSGSDRSDSSDQSTKLL